MSRALDDLDPAFRVKVCQLLARTVEAGIPVLIVDTLRTKAEQAVNLAKGTSWTMLSKHLADKAGKAHAIDLCPFAIYRLHGPDELQWDPTDSVWARIGAIGGTLGLKWGIWLNGRHIDLGHFEDKD